jgi:hypothetical protein
VASTFITLLVIPVIYTYLAPKRNNAMKSKAGYRPSSLNVSEIVQLVEVKGVY